MRRGNGAEEACIVGGARAGVGSDARRVERVGRGEHQAHELGAARHRECVREARLQQLRARIDESERALVGYASRENIVSRTVVTFVKRTSRSASGASGGVPS